LRGGRLTLERERACGNWRWAARRRWLLTRLGTQFVRFSTFNFAAVGAYYGCDLLFWLPSGLRWFSTCTLRWLAFHAATHYGVHRTSHSVDSNG
jgi:hypothetical protein